MVAASRQILPGTRLHWMTTKWQWKNVRGSVLKTRIITSLVFKTECNVCVGTKYPNISILYRSRNVQCHVLVTTLKSAGAPPGWMFIKVRGCTHNIWQHFCFRFLDYLNGECFSNTPTNRILPYLVKKDRKDMSVDLCKKLCFDGNDDDFGGGGYVYAGVQNTEECWCGNAKPPQNYKQKQSECTKPCPGDNSQKCGDRYMINVYRNKGKVPELTWPAFNFPIFMDSFTSRGQSNWLQMWFGQRG